MSQCVVRELCSFPPHTPLPALVALQLDIITPKEHAVVRHALGLDRTWVLANVHLQQLNLDSGGSFPPLDYYIYGAVLVRLSVV